MRLPDLRLPATLKTAISAIITINCFKNHNLKILNRSIKNNQMTDLRHILYTS